MKTPLFVVSDIALLKSLLMNLVSNAIKFTSQGGILISARPRGDKILLQVWDTGIGISADNIPHIFDEFYQVGNSQRNREVGLGLGLSICQRTASLLDVELKCRSQLGRGSVFEMLLPCDFKQNEVLPLLPNINMQNKADIKILAKGKRIVVIEDDVLVSAGLVSLLQVLEAEVRCFSNAEEALQHDDFANADFFIVDFALGGELSGLDFLRALQKRQKKRVHAVIATGETSSEFMKSMVDSPWPVMHKPISLAKLGEFLSSAEVC